MKKIYSVLVFAIIALTYSSVYGQNFSIVGNGTTSSGSNNWNPYYNYYLGQRSQFFVTAAQLNAAGIPANSLISSLGFNIVQAGSGNSATLNGWTVTVRTTTATNPLTAWLTTGQVSQSTPTNLSVTSTGWNQTSLPSFVWNGTDNLVIETCYNNSGWSSTYARVQVTTSGLGSGTWSRWYRADINTVCSSTSTTSTSTTTRPNMRFGWVPNTSCSGTPSAGTATISSPSGCPSVNFTLGSSGTTSGTGISYQWQSAPAAGGPWTNIAGATNTSLTTSTTTTTFYRLQTTCANSGLSNNTNTVSYTVSGGQCECGTYSSIFASDAADSEISSVTVGSMTNNTNTCVTAAPGPGSIAGRYSNFTGSVTGPSAQQGSSVPFTVVQNSCSGSNYGNIIQIYVDWNQNGIFDISEMMYQSGLANNTAPGVSGNFTVPAGATVGTTRMRIVCIEGGTAGVNYAQTQTYTWGETEDYCFTVTAATLCSGTPNAGSSSINVASGCAGSAIALSATGLTIGSGISYQWQSAPAAAGPWTNIAGATNTTFNTTGPATTTFYRLVTTCSNGGATNTTNAVSFTPVTCCNYTFVLTDSWGDGWDGATMDVRIGTTVVATLGPTFTTGFTQNIPVQIANGTNYNLFYSNGGTFPSEVGIQIFDPNGVLVYNLPAGSGTVGTQLTTWTGNCAPSVTSPTSITASTTTICAGAGTNVTLTANGASGTVHWFVGLCGSSGSFATGNSTVVSPTVTTTYFARNFNGTAWSPNCATITIVVNNPPTGILSNASPTTICNGQQTNLTSSATYSSTIHQAQNETDFLQFITNDPKWAYDFTANAGGASPELFFNWTPSSTGLFWAQFGSMINASGYTNVNFQFKHFVDDFSGAYTLRLQTSPDGVTWTDRWTLNPSGNVGPATVNLPLTVLNNSSFFYRFVFDGNSINIDEWRIDDIIITGTPPAISYSWSSSPSGFSSNLQNTTASPNVTTNYTVTASSNGCSSSSNINVTVNPIPAAPTTTNDNICYGATGFPSANTSVNWYTLSTGGTFLGTAQTYTTPSLTATTTYYVEANVNGCISSRVPVTVNVNPFPNSVAPTTTTATGCNIVDPNNWVYLVDPSNTIVAAVNDPTGNNPMGQTAASVTIMPTVQTFNGKPYIQRVVSINPTNSVVPAVVRLYFTDSEFQNLQQAVGPFLTSYTQLGVTKFDGPGLTGNSVYIQPSQWLTPGQTGMPNVYALEFNVGSFSTFAIHPNNNNTPLPIKLINFDVENQKNYVDINWSTAVEINNDFFTVERSSEGENFEEVMKVKGAGNSNEIIYYSEVDYKPLKGQSYYRLKQTDFDGTSTYSEIKAVYIENKIQDNGAIVYPNPLRGENFQVKIITQEEEEVSIEIFDNSGKKLKSTSFTSKIGVNESHQNTNRLGPGIYTVKITGEISGVSFHKLIISN